MGIEISSNFDVKTGLPLDGRTVVADTTARDAIASLQRFEGMIVYSIADAKNFQLQGGITNSDWVDIAGSVALTLTTEGSSGAATLVGDTLNIPVYGGSTSPFVFDTNGTAIVTQVSDFTPTGGNPRGNYALDSQSSRTDAAQVASGSKSVVLGGDNNKASGEYSFAQGFENTSTGNQSFVHGWRGNDYGVPTRHVIGCEEDVQISNMPICVNATDINPLSVLNSNRGDGTSSTLLLQNNQAVAFSGVIAVYAQNSANMAAWIISGFITRFSDAASTLLQSSNIETIFNSGGHGLSIEADTSAGALNVYYISPTPSVTYRVAGNLHTADVISLQAPT